MSKLRMLGTTGIKRVLVVDDEEIMHKTIRRCVESWFSMEIKVTGFWTFWNFVWAWLVDKHVEVTGFRSPEDLLKWLPVIVKDVDPFEILVLTSYKLTGMKGTDLILTIQRLYGSAINTVVMTSLPDEVQRDLPGVPMVIKPDGLTKLREFMLKM